MSTLVIKPASKVFKVVSCSLLLLMASGTSFSSWASTHAPKSTGEAINQKSMQVLQLTEEALRVLRINPDESLAKVEEALTLIELIEQSNGGFAVSTRNDTSNRYTQVNHAYQYPLLDRSMFEENTEYTALKSKFKQDILYIGNEKKANKKLEAYFDYSFAKGSLQTARQALKAQHGVESMRALNWVFEAVYLSPEFDIKSAT